MIRLATADDAERVREIYAPFCLPSSAVSFEIEAPSLTEMASRISNTLPNYPWLVFEDESGNVIGYAYAGQHKTRAAYNWSAEASVYLHEQARGKGIGRRLYRCLFDLLKEQGYFNVYGGVTLPNPASIGLHKSMGFKDVGIYEKVGFKNGSWHDVLWLVLHVQAHEATPVGPIPFSKLDPILIERSIAKSLLV